MLAAGDLIAFTVRHDGPVVRVTAQHGNTEGHGAAPDIGTLGRDVAAIRATRDLIRRMTMTTDADAYRDEWAAKTGRSPRDIYIPEALREPEPVTMGTCPNGGDHTPGTSGQWVGRCTKCGTPC